MNLAQVLDRNIVLVATVVDIDQVDHASYGRRGRRWHRFDGLLVNAANQHSIPIVLIGSDNNQARVPLWQNGSHVLIVMSRHDHVQLGELRISWMGGLLQEKMSGVNDHRNDRLEANIGRQLKLLKQKVTIRTSGNTKEKHK